MGELERNKKAIMAADLTTRIAEDLLAVGTLSYGQLHLYEPKIPVPPRNANFHSVFLQYSQPCRFIQLSLVTRIPLEGSWPRTELGSACWP